MTLGGLTKQFADRDAENLGNPRHPRALRRRDSTLPVGDRRLVNAAQLSESALT